MARLMPNGNVEITVQLLPSAYAALTATCERDKGSYADIVNVAVITYAAISATASEAGHDLSMAEEATDE